MKLLTTVSLITMACLTASPCRAGADKYHVTPSEKAACSDDAMRLCWQTYPNEDSLLSCMMQNRASLTTMCRVAFDAGVKRRKL